MIRSSRNIRTIETSSGAAAVELIAGPARLLKVKEIGIALVNATASKFALGYPAALGITPTTPVSLLSMAAADPVAISGKLAVAWGTGPTIPAAFFRQCSLAATIGAERIWKFKSPLIVLAGTSLILWTLSAVSVADVYFTVEE